MATRQSTTKETWIVTGGHTLEVVTTKDGTETSRKLMAALFGQAPRILHADTALELSEALREAALAAGATVTRTRTSTERQSRSRSMKNWKEANENRKRRLAWVQRIQEVMLALERHGGPPPDDIGLGHCDWGLPGYGIVRLCVTLGEEVRLTISTRADGADKLRAAAPELLPPNTKTSGHWLDAIESPEAFDVTVKRWATLLARFYSPDGQKWTAPTHDHFTDPQGDPEKCVEQRSDPYFDPTVPRKPKLSEQALLRELHRGMIAAYERASDMVLRGDHSRADLSAWLREEARVLSKRKE